MACNGEERDVSQEDTPPEEILKSYEHLIAQDLKRIEEQGGEHADQLKASLYEKWVPELLDTISMLCKTTSELEQVSANAVVQLDHKLQETASSARTFMHRSAELEESCMQNCSYASMESTFQQMCSHQDNHSGADMEGNSLFPLETQLQQTQQALEECQAKCQVYEKTIQRLEGELKELQDKLAKREKQIDDLLRNQAVSQTPMEDEEKKRLEQLISEKDAELQKIVAQKRLFEKRACDREDKIKALTMEVAAKHDVALQLEDRLKQAQQRDDKHQMQLNYQSMLLDALRKELRKYKKEKSSPGSDESPTKETSIATQTTHSENSSLPAEEKEGCLNKVDASKSKEFVQLERRLEELEMMLRAKDEIISRMSLEAAPSRSQPRTAAAVHQMSPEELKITLINKEKEIEEQRELIGQLQDALIASKHKLEEVQREGSDTKDEVIHCLQQDLAEMEAQYRDCFSEVCKQNQQLQLLREANQEYLERSKLHEKNNAGSKTSEQEATKAGNQLADVECELAFAKAQLSIYKTKNLELQDEIYKMRNNKSPTEKELEKMLNEKDICISEKNNLILELQEKLSVNDITLSEEFVNLQTCISDGATIIYDKDLQITLLQEKLNEICNEAESQLNMLSGRDVSLGHLLASLDQVNDEKELLLAKVELLEIQQQVVDSNTSKETKTVATNTSRNISRESSVDKRTKDALQEEILELRYELKTSKQDLKIWKQKYEVINTNLLAKEKKIVDLKCQIEESKSNSKLRNSTTRELREAQKQVTELREQLQESESQLEELRSSCEEKEQTIEALRLELQDEIERSQDIKERDEERIDEAEQQVLQLQDEILELKSNYETKEQQLEELYNEKEIELQRLLTISCENVLGLQDANSELTKKLELSELKAKKLSEELEEEQKLKCEKLEELAEARKELESVSGNCDSLQDQLTKAEIEIVETKDQLSKFETELMLSTEKILQLQTYLTRAQAETQAATAQLASLRAEQSSQALAQQQQLAEVSARLQSTNAEKLHLERSHDRLEEMCKALSVQVGGQRSERDRAVRGLKQAAAERSRLCQEARQVLSVARQWLAEHRASALEMQTLRADRDRLMKENAALRHRRHNTVLNPWGGLVDREESGFWSSHWTTQLEEVDQEIEGLRLQDEEWGEEEGVECKGDTGYQSGGSSK